MYLFMSPFAEEPEWVTQAQDLPNLGFFSATGAEKPSFVQGLNMFEHDRTICNPGHLKLE